jgi:hypothetical protein
MPGELSAADKLSRLKQYRDAHGTLEGRNGPQEFDIRNVRL